MATTEFDAGPLSNGVVALAGGCVTEQARAPLQQQLATIRLEFAEVYRELYEAAQMQRKLSGPRLSRRGPFAIAAEIFPVRHLSGDFFNVSDLGETTLLAVGDIAGKGLLAGMWFTHVIELTRLHGELTADPAAALHGMNRQICGSESKPPLTSIFLARLMPTGELLYCNAGHPPPILQRADGALHWLNEGGPVLGAVADAHFECARILMYPGDTLLAYSDGLLECRNERDEEFGVDRMIEELLKASGASTAATLFSIIGAAQDFAGTHAREDDCSLMVVRYHQPEATHTIGVVVEKSRAQPGR